MNGFPPLVKEPKPKPQPQGATCLEDWKGWKLKDERKKAMWIPDALWEVNPFDIRSPEADDLRQYMWDLREHYRDRKGLILHGPYGSGKSAIAAMVLMVAAQNKIGGHYRKWIRADRWQKYVIEKTTYLPDCYHEYLVADTARHADWLVIDELIPDSRDSFAIRELESLIRERVENRLFTIITTNASPAEWEERHPSLAAVFPQLGFVKFIDGYNWRTGERT